MYAIRSYYEKPVNGNEQYLVARGGKRADKGREFGPLQAEDHGAVAGDYRGGAVNFQKETGLAENLALAQGAYENVLAARLAHAHADGTGQHSEKMVVQLAFPNDRLVSLVLQDRTGLYHFVQFLIGKVFEGHDVPNLLPPRLLFLECLHSEQYNLSGRIRNKRVFENRGNARAAHGIALDQFIGFPEGVIKVHRKLRLLG